MVLQFNFIMLVPEHVAFRLFLDPAVDAFEVPCAVVAVEVDWLGFHFVELFQGPQVWRGHLEAIL